MRRTQFSELNAFVAAAEHQSFTRAAAALGLRTPALSQAIRSLEEKLGVRLLNRTTRSVSLTEPGEVLLTRVRPLMDGLDDAIAAVGPFRDTPTGTLRLSVIRNVATEVLAPLLPEFLAQYPQMTVEIAVDDTHSDLVSGRFDAGIQIGERIEKDMVAARLFGPADVILAASPAYVERHGQPERLSDLGDHNCVRVRSLWDGSIHPWEFELHGEKIAAAVHGSLIVNDTNLALRAALGGIGIIHVPEPLANPYIASGQLMRVLPDHALPSSGIHIYYPSRRQPSAALRVFVDFMRSRTRGMFTPERGNGRRPGENQAAASVI
jgi:DNA-binding transcriptional LysR family regulator